MNDPWQDFKLNKTIQAIHYLVRELGRSNFMKILKLMYFADRYHLRKYGIGITSDDYKAMKYGTVGSSTMNVLKEDPTFFGMLDSADKSYYDRLLKREEMEISMNAECEYDELSKSEREALRFAVGAFGRFDQFKLADLTHDYPEWKKYRALFEKNLVKVEDEDYLDFFEDPDLSDSPNLRKYLGGEDPFSGERTTLDAIKEFLLEKESAI